MIELLKYLQKTKWISRRDFLEMIQEQAVYINENLVTDIKQKIEKWDILTVKLNDKEEYEEKITSLPRFRPVIAVFNKPKWYVVSKSDKHNKTIFELLPKSRQKDFYYIWRLDKYSHWLLLLTNSPEIVDYYENPKNKIIKIYEVKTDKPLKTSHIQRLKTWLNVDPEWKINWEWSELLAFYDVKKVKNIQWKETLRILLKEWKNRHIRRLLKALWYNVTDLKRVKVWKYEVWTVKPWKYLIHNIRENKKKKKKSNKY